ncbi:phage antirepressor protein [Pseudomonas gingeri NCPPB 3146 = LMG 5327]|uniref:Bro-N domain-containing protein n=3 Tax=Pseudomonas TaxID=286 RepID=A0A7Y8CF60_9PSED|nr:Bro-N domain-containing protein [Pseudomonas gingeri]NWC16885.1 Bro-N domain-containing protein [Pseudomonas gingeri]NWE45670.1 Bro-N domain-containing protein [Pseudomonas gingeri]PNQ91727.1 phage antirepressor protein [Pseudomonas gingeri NCPPB 3146 = LMG 5327]
MGKVILESLAETIQNLLDNGSAYDVSEQLGLAVNVAFEPQIFTRHHRKLRALLLHDEAWFCARDIGYLMGIEWHERKAIKLDSDQRRLLSLQGNGGAEEHLMLSESGVYAMLVYHYLPENRHLRQWLTHQVLPMLRDQPQLALTQAPSLGLLEWNGGALSLLHWRKEPWIRLRDMPQVVPVSGCGRVW